MREILVSGSVAYDSLMYYDGDFRGQFPDGNIEQGLNMSLLCEKHDKFLGGTGLNMSYNLALLGENPILLSSVGNDFVADSLSSEKVNLSYLHKESQKFTAGSFIISDNQDHRITIFHPGAMVASGESKVSYVTETIGIAIVSANQISAMLEHARELYSKDIPFFVDPAQQITAMTPDELREFLNLGTYLIANQHEMKELQLKASLDDEQLSNMFEKIIITYSAYGSELREGENITHIDAVVIDNIEDVTGAGDAYRAGVLKGVMDGYSWINACRLGSVLASYCVQVEGAQNHHVSLGNISQDMKTYFGKDIDLYIKRKY